MQRLVFRYKNTNLLSATSGSRVVKISIYFSILSHLIAIFLYLAIYIFEEIIEIAISFWVEWSLSQLHILKYPFAKVSGAHLWGQLLSGLLFTFFNLLYSSVMKILHCLLQNIQVVKSLLTIRLRNPEQWDWEIQSLPKSTSFTDETKTTAYHIHYALKFLRYICKFWGYHKFSFFVILFSRITMPFKICRFCEHNLPSMHM